MNDFVNIKYGSYSGALYLVVANEWFPLDGKYWKKGTVFDYDADLGTYINGTLNYSIAAFDSQVDDYLKVVYKHNLPISLNKAAQAVLEMIMEDE